MANVREGSIVSIDRFWKKSMMEWVDVDVALYRNPRELQLVFKRMSPNKRPVEIEVDSYDAKSHSWHTDGTLPAKQSKEAIATILRQLKRRGYKQMAAILETHPKAI